MSLAKMTNRYAVIQAIDEFARENNFPEFKLSKEYNLYDIDSDTEYECGLKGIGDKG